MRCRPLVAGRDRREVRQLRHGRGLRPRFPARRQRARHPIGVQPRPGAVGDDRVQPGVQGVDEWLVLLGDRPRHEIVQAEGVFDDLRGIARLNRALRLLRRRHPRVDLTRLEAGIDGVVVGELHRLQVQRVDDVRLLDGALHDADALAGGQLFEAGGGVSVREPDGAPTRIGGGDRRRPHVEAPRRHLREQPGELGADEVDVQPEPAGDRAQQLVVEAGELAGRIDADARRRIRQRADGQRARRTQAQGVDVDGGQRLDRRGRVFVGAGTRRRLREIGGQRTGALDSRQGALVDVGARRRRQAHARDQQWRRGSGTGFNSIRTQPARRKAGRPGVVPIHQS